MSAPAIKVADGAVQTTLSLLEELFRGITVPEIAVRLWDGTVFRSGSPGFTRCTLVLQHPGSLRAMFLPPTELNLAEAYLYDDYDIEGEITALTPLLKHILEKPKGKLDSLRLGARLLSLPNTARPRSGATAANLHGSPHTKERDRAATNFHYERPMEFFALWLDPGMAYSCGYVIEPDDDLETAQQQKLEYLCRKLRLKAGERLLDIGCGWGGLLIYAAQHYGVRADGITLSPKQAEWARECIRKAGLEESCDVMIRDYREIAPEGYDKVVSVSVAEHIGEPLMKTYFQAAWEALRPGGVFLNHGIGIHSTAPIVGREFIHRYVFPDGEPLPIATTLQAAESVGFQVRDVENLGDHYVYTLRHWLRRYEERAQEVKQVVDEITYRSWRIYLAIALSEFEVGTGQLYQTLLLKRPEPRRSGMPLTRLDWYS